MLTQTSESGRIGIKLYVILIVCFIIAAVVSDFWAKISQSTEVRHSETSLHGSLGKEISRQEFETRMRAYHETHNSSISTSTTAGNSISWRNGNSLSLSSAIKDWSLDQSLEKVFKSDWREYVVTKDVRSKDLYIYLNDDDFDLSNSKPLIVSKISNSGEILFDETKTLPKGPWLVKNFYLQYCGSCGCGCYIDTEMQIANGKIFMGIYASDDYATLAAEKTGIYYLNNEEWIQIADGMQGGINDNFSLDSSGCIVTYSVDQKYYEANICSLDGAYQEPSNGVDAVEQSTVTTEPLETQVNADVSSTNVETSNDSILSEPDIKIIAPAAGAVLHADELTTVQWDVKHEIVNSFTSDFYLYIFLSLYKQVSDTESVSSGNIGDGHLVYTGSTIWNIPVSISSGSLTPGTYKIAARLQATPKDRSRLCNASASQSKSDCLPSDADRAEMLRSTKIVGESDWFTIAPSDTN